MRKAAIILIVCVLAGAALGFGGDMGVGTEPLTNGSSGYPWLIEDVDDFHEFASNSDYWASNVYTKLVYDPNLSGDTYTTAVIAPDTDVSEGNFQGDTFDGVFDGNGHVISNLTISGLGHDFVGLFGKVRGQIINLRIENASIHGRDYVGGLAGYLDDGIISQCSVNITIQGDGQYCGLLVGYCYGVNSGVNIKSSFSDGILTGTISSGGLLGAGKWCQIANCYSMANITGEEDTGGLMGSMKLEGASIINSYAAGSVSGQTRTGGLLGSCDTGVVADCYWDVGTTGQTYSPGGGGGLANEDMMKKETYLGWGCGSEWVIDPNNDYPRLAWEGTGGETITKATIVYGGGQGTVEDPYLIFTAKQFRNLSLFECDWDYSFKLMDDIDMGPYVNNQFSGIGLPVTNIFRGNFDGNNKKIINLTLSGDGRAYGGMFGYIGGVGTVIKNIYLENINIQTGGHNTAGLIGRSQANDLVIENCHILSGSVHGAGSTGGLLGFSLSSDNITVLNCSSAAEVHGTRVGGLLGYCSDFNVYRSYATGDVYGTSEVGGFIGRASNPMAIYDSYATGDVHGTTEVGGFIGEIWDYWYPVTLRRCYSTGEVTGDNDIGGFCSDDESIYNSYWNIDTSGLTYSGDATGLSDVDFKKQSSFVSWNFSETWSICEGTNYPRLQWQIPVGDYLCPDGVSTEDLSFLLDHWLTSDGADLNGDTIVDLRDFAIFAANWFLDVE